MADRLYRFFLDSGLKGPDLRLAGDELHHLRHVLRLAEGAEVALFDGRGQECRAEVVKLSKSEALLRVVDGPTTSPESPVRITLAWAVCKSKATDWIIQKATELGVSCLQPFWAARSVVKAKDAENQAGKWRRLTVEAAKQCGRSYLPDVREGVSFERMLAASAGHDTRIFLDPGARTALREALRGRGGKSVWLAVGPEGGFASGETAAAATAGLMPANLGTNILRSETACIAAVACVRYELG